MIALLFLATASWAQERIVTGKVTSTEDGAAVPGVNVLVKGTTNGTATDADGSFSININSADDVLVFSFIGFATREITVGNQSSIAVALDPDITVLSEVVIRVPYGETQRGLFTGSVAQLGDKQLKQRPVTNVINALAGAAPGIQTTAGSGQPGAAASIRVRGMGSYTASNDPLYVVDGVPYSGNIANLNMNDIEDISVLKDASSAAIYGSRAANGVIMITTKKGRKDRTQIELNLMQGVMSRGIPEYERVNAREYYPLMWEAYKNSLVYPASGTGVPEDVAANLATGTLPRFTTGTNAGKQNYNGKAYSDIGQLLGYNPFNVGSTEIVLPDGTLNPNAQLIYSEDDMDWAKPITRDGSRSDYTMSITSGTDKSDVFVSMGYLNEKGFVIKSDFERFTGRINLNTKPLDWFRTGLNISGAITTSNQANVPAAGGTGYVNPFFFARTIGPIYPVYAQNPTTGEMIYDPVTGGKIYDLGNMTSLGLPSRPSGANVGRHIVAETELNNNLFTRNVLSARTFGEITFLKNFKFTTNVSVDVTSSLTETFENTLVGDGAPAGRARRTTNNTTSYNLNQLLSYTKPIGDHNINVLLGHENYNWKFSTVDGFKQGMVAAGNYELDNFTTINTLGSRTDRYRTEGYFTRLSYDFKEKYILSASYRRDGSSRFSPDKRWGDFWALGGAWRLDNESFMSAASAVDLLKLRVSFGESGNDGVNDANGDPDYYPWMALYNLGANNADEPGLIQAKLPGEDLLWETNRSLDIGVDYSLFENRINGSIEFFNRQSTNLLFAVPLPLSSGLQSKFENVGTMYNRGIEFHIAADILRKGDFTWNIDLNGTTLKNKITKLPQKEIVDGQHKREVGSSIYDFWLRDWYGVNPENGAGLYRANQWLPANTFVLENGDTVTTSQNNARFHYAGTAIPDVYGGVTNTFTYKNFTLSFLMTYQLGGYVYDGVYASLMATGTYGAAIHKDALKRWQKPGDVTDVPRMDDGQRTIFGAASDRWLTKASYLTLRTANLTYNIPSAYAAKVGLQTARVFLSGENLALFSARKGMNVTQNFGGTTTNVFSPNRIYTIGLNVTL